MLFRGVFVRDGERKLTTRRCRSGERLDALVALGASAVCATLLVTAITIAKAFVTNEERDGLSATAIAGGVAIGVFFIDRDYAIA